MNLACDTHFNMVRSLSRMVLGCFVLTVDSLLNRGNLLRILGEQRLKRGERVTRDAREERGAKN